MKLYAYLMTCDDGFAPNPFYGYCTLACCKPTIRRTAKKGDWIIGIRGKSLYENAFKKSSNEKSEVFKIVYAMQVGESLPFDRYWRDKRFQFKKPLANVMDKRCAGDNIYKPKPNSNGFYKPLENRNGHSKQGNQRHDLGGKKVLISSKNNFYYFGIKALHIPDDMRHRIVKSYATWGKNGQGHLCNFEKPIKDEIINHIQKNQPGRHAYPSEWENMEIKKSSFCTPKISKPEKKC